MSVFFEGIVIVFLILMNGLLSMAEFALVSSRRTRLEQMQAEGISGAETALEISGDPNTFLSAIQIGITLIGILAGAYGGASLAGKLAPLFEISPYTAPYGDTISLVLIVLVITFITIVIGELVPKRIGLSDPEGIAARMAGSIRILVLLTRPVIRLTSWATDLVLLVAGAAGPAESTVTEEEITVLLEEGTRAGVFNETEQEIVQSVFRFADRDVASIMVPRPDLVALNLDDPFEMIRETIMSTGHTRYPVYRNEIDQISGVISVRDLWVHTTGGEIGSLDTLVMPVLMVPETLSTLRLLEMFKSAVSPLAVIVDEYGSVLGIVTLHDLMEAIVGDMDSVDITSGDPDVVERDDGSWFVDGTYAVIDLKRLLDLESLPGEEEGHYRTIAGFLMAELDRIPRTGDIIRYGGFSFEVADMDGHRIDKILITRMQPDEGTEAGMDSEESREPGSS